MELDYPVATPSGVAPEIYRAQIIQTMALTFQKAVPDLTDKEAHAAAMATWETDWPNDPAPRTVQDGIDNTNDELAYWGED